MLRVLTHIDGFVSPFTCLWATTFPVRSRHVKVPLPDLPLEIWLEIFQWSTYFHGATTIGGMDPFTVQHSPTDVMGNTPILSLRTKCALVQVCRLWRRIAIQIQYQHIVIRSPSRAALILQVLRDSHSEKSNYGYWTRHIEVFTHARGSSDIRFLQTLFRIFQYCPRLRMLSATWRIVVPREFLDAVSTLYGSTLQGLNWDEQKHSLEKTHASLNFLASFKFLRILDLRHFVGDGLLSGEGLEPATLPSLKHIILSNQGCNIAAATALELPALHTLTLQTLIGYSPRIDLVTKLLARHGASLITVHLPSPSSGSESEHSQPRIPSQHIPPSLFLSPGVCPNLDTISFGANSPPFTYEPTVMEPHAHPSLRRIALLSVRADALYPSKGPNETQTHLRSFTRAAYPQLEMVRTAGFLVDADTDSLVKDVFIWWSERFERDGVDFQDGEGVVWMYGDDVEENVASSKLLLDSTKPIHS
ncbi:hypothetical protein MSAN_00076800 [Mycena sanguinolenta]|uniref:F-box domain-containing protein n=1 Tax=Mycena sanguinolenta TaxID=230812 RepID=A0A8H7DKD1_9AGAR|nr:hypothetical protein MSAN_00076800 [Mycena sanguinolenta]